MADRCVNRELTDTAPEIAAYYRAALARLSGAERVRMACDMFETARALVLASLPPEVRQHPVARRIHLLTRFYGHDLDPAFFNAIVRRIEAEGGAAPDR